MIEKFRQKTYKQFNKIGSLTITMIEDFVLEHIVELMDKYEVNIKIIEVFIAGSRSVGLENENSDIDIILVYEGVAKEDFVFNLLNEEKLFIDNIEVDINPIKSDRIDSYLLETEKYLEKKAHKLLL